MEAVQHVLLNSRKPSTRVTYLAKWKQFSVWFLAQKIRLMLACIENILEYLLMPSVFWSLDQFTEGSLSSDLGLLSTYLREVNFLKPWGSEISNGSH